MRKHLSICLTRKFKAFLLKARSNRLKVLDDPVVHYADEVARKMRMRIAHFGSTVRRPARMRNARLRLELFSLCLLNEFAHASHGTRAVQTRIIHGSNTAGIVSAVFKTSKALEQNRNNISVARGSNNPTHSCLVSQLVLCRQAFFVGRCQPSIVVCLLRASVSLPSGAAS